MSTTAFDDQFAPEPPATFVAVPIPQAMIEMSRKMRAQDARCTAEPIYEIRKIKEIPWVEADTADGWVWLDEGDNLVTTPELIAALDKHVETDGFDRDTEVDDEENVGHDGARSRSLKTGYGPVARAATQPGFCGASTPGRRAAPAWGLGGARTGRIVGGATGT